MHAVVGVGTLFTVFKKNSLGFGPRWFVIGWSIITVSSILIGPYYTRVTLVLVHAQLYRVVYIDYFSIISHCVGINLE